MSDAPVDAIAHARAEAQAARADLFATLGELQARLHPRGLARNALEEVRDRGEDFAERSVEFARTRPAAAVGLAATALLLLARRPIARLFSRRHATPPRDHGLDPQFRPTPAAPRTKDRA